MIYNESSSPEAELLLLPSARFGLRLQGGRRPRQSRDGLEIARI